MKDSMTEAAASAVSARAEVAKAAFFSDASTISGRYHAELWVLPDEHKGEYSDLMMSVEAGGDAEPFLARMAELDKLRTKQWEDDFSNVVTTVGKNLTLDTILAGSAFTATVVMGLAGTGTKAAADTQASHAGWTERGAANAPAYSGTRKTPAFSAASAGSKATSAAVSFTFTSGGNVDGCFININGSSTIDNTTGTLYSAGDFTGGAKTVANTDVLNITYSSTLT